MTDTSPLIDSLIEAHNEKRKRAAKELSDADTCPAFFSEAFVNRAIRQFQRAQANLRYWAAQR